MVYYLLVKNLSLNNFLWIKGYLSRRGRGLSYWRKVSHIILKSSKGFVVIIIVSLSIYDKEDKEEVTLVLEYAMSSQMQ